MTSDYPRLLQQAISRNPRMLLVGEFFPDGMDPLIKEATAAGIPVLIHNSGQFFWADNGSIGFIGEDPYQMGFKAGEIQAEKPASSTASASTRCRATRPSRHAAPATSTP